MPTATHYEPRFGPDTIAKTRFNFLQLQALVTVVLSYQVLFTKTSSFPVEAQLLCQLLVQFLRSGGERDVVPRCPGVGGYGHRDRINGRVTECRL